MSEHTYCVACGASELGCRDGDCCGDCGHDEPRTVFQRPHRRPWKGAS